MCSDSTYKVFWGYDDTMDVSFGYKIDGVGLP